MCLTDIIQPELTIHDLLNAFPVCSEYFLKNTLLCIGCVGETHHTIAEVSQSYALDLDLFISDLKGLVVSRSTA